MLITRPLCRRLFIFYYWSFTNQFIDATNHGCSPVTLQLFVDGRNKRKDSATLPVMLIIGHHSSYPLSSYQGAITDWLYKLCVYYTGYYSRVISRAYPLSLTCNVIHYLPSHRSWLMRLSYCLRSFAMVLNLQLDTKQPLCWSDRPGLL